jgi:hypothetical protein
MMQAMAEVLLGTSQAKARQFKLPKVYCTHILDRGSSINLTVEQCCSDRVTMYSEEDRTIAYERQRAIAVTHKKEQQHVSLVFRPLKPDGRARTCR